MHRFLEELKYWGEERNLCLDIDEIGFFFFQLEFLLYFKFGILFLDPELQHKNSLKL